MQTTMTIGYDQVFELAWQLSPGERERLAKEIVLPETEPVKSVMEPRQGQEMSKEGDDEFLMTFPAISEEEVEKCRQDALRLALECPVATQEEIENYNEFRRHHLAPVGANYTMSPPTH